MSLNKNKKKLTNECILLSSLIIKVFCIFRDLKMGDHLTVPGQRDGIKYFHHGIFISHKDGVIDFGGADKETATVRQIDLFEFASDPKSLFRVIYPEKILCFKPKEVVERAELLLNDPKSYPDYNALTNNCEHFATSCKTGAGISLQAIGMFIESTKKLLGLAIANAGSLNSSSGNLS